MGQHRDPTDKKLDQAILHTDNETEYGTSSASSTRSTRPTAPSRLGGKTENVPAFNITFSVN